MVIKVEGNYLRNLAVPLKPLFVKRLVIVFGLEVARLEEWVIKVHPFEGVVSLLDL